MLMYLHQSIDQKIWESRARRRNLTIISRSELFPGLEFKGSGIRTTNYIASLQQLSEIPWLAIKLVFWQYLSHVKSDLDGVKRKVGLWFTKLTQSKQLTSKPPACLPELPWLAMIFSFWPYYFYFKSDFDGWKRK